MTTINIQITGERLAAMSDNDMSLYCTPGSSQPYWSSHPSFMYDKVIATPQDFLEAAGYDELDNSLDEEIFDLDVELIEER